MSFHSAPQDGYNVALLFKPMQYESVRIPRPPDGYKSRAFIKNEDGTTRAGELNTSFAFAILNDDVWSDILRFIGPKCS